MLFDFTKRVCASASAAERGGNNFNHFNGFRTENGSNIARLWPWLAHLFQVRSTAYYTHISAGYENCKYANMSYILYNKTFSKLEMNFNPLETIQNNLKIIWKYYQHNINKQYVKITSTNNMKVETAFRLGMMFDFLAMFAVLEYYMGWEILVIFSLIMVNPNR